MKTDELNEYAQLNPIAQVVIPICVLLFFISFMAFIYFLYKITKDE